MAVEERALRTVDNPVSPATANQLWTAEDRRLIQETVAKGTTESEFKLFLYTAAKYQLDPLVKQVWCVKYDAKSPAQIFCGRDGFLSIAHRSGQFDGMESGTKMIDGELYGWCTVYRKDMDHPFTVEVPLSEYNTGRNLWKDKPRTMIQKVAESQALRRAFDISGIYSPEEFEPEQQPQEPINVTPQQSGVVPEKATKPARRASKAQQKATDKMEQFVHLLQQLAETIQACGVEPANEAERNKLFRSVGGPVKNPKSMTPEEIIALNQRLRASLELPREAEIVHDAVPDAEQIAERCPF